MKVLRILLAAAIAVMVAASTALAAPMQPPKEIDRSTRFIEEELLCQCGCTMGVAVCDCGTAEEIRKTIAGMMGEGKSKPEILAAFVAQYGEQVLQAPTKSGFNLSAWITPFAVLLLGLAVLVVLIRAWVLRYRTTEALAGPAATEGPAELTEDEKAYASRIDEFLRRHY